MIQRCLRNKLVGRLAYFSLVVVSFLLARQPARAATLVQEFYLPMPESQIYQANGAIISGTSSTINSTFSIVVTGDGTVIYYDQWEDGYETDLSNPTQSTTQIWGDGNDAHGIPPGFAHNPLGLPAGTVITLTNNVTQPRNPSVIQWDARDRIAATKALVISRAAWPVSPGPVFAGAVGVLSTLDYGTNYIIPVGQNLTNNLFKYVGVFVMAEQNNTAVTIDPNGTGSGTTNIVLNQGESYLVNGGVKKGGRITASKPVQADLVIGHVGTAYASDWFTLYPAEEWSSSYYTPVSSAASGSQPAYVYLFNPNTNAITVNYATKSGSGSFSVPGTNGVFQFQMPIGSGASFISAGGQNFFAICTVAANPASDTAYNWGFTLVPQSALTTEAVVGWGPGSADGTVDGSPVWATALANTTLYVDYNGDQNGPLIDPNGNHYDTNFTVAALQSQKIYAPSKNQTGTKVYTVDGTLITAAWGEDPDKASPGNPYIDAGTTVLPFPVPSLIKSAVIVTDLPPAGLSVGDTIAYSVEVDNKGLLPLGNTLVIDAPSTNLLYVASSTTYNGSPIPDSATGTPFPLDAPGFTIPVILSRGTSTFTYLCQVTGGGVVSNSVNIGGSSIFSSASLVPAPASGATVSLIFTDTNGGPVSLYSVAANVFVTMTNAAGNTSSNTVQTIPVTVVDATHGDLQTILLTETGTNTGIFRNTNGLPTSATAGVAPQDGILNVTPGDVLSVSYTDPNYGDSASSTAAIQIPALTKQLYLSWTNGVQALDRVDPVAYAHSPTRTSLDIGSGGAWPYYQTITISHTNVFGTDQTNFPVLINLASNTGLQNHAQASGNDIRFTASDGVTLLSYEREKYTGATGALVAWVKVPLLSHATDTVIYMFYGNSGASDQQNASGVWDANYKGVWHLDQTPTGAAGDIVDSTGGNNGTSQTLAAGAQVAGKIGGSLTLNGTSAYISTATSFANPQTVMVEAWVKTTTVNGGKVVGFENTQTGTGSANYDRHIYFNTNGKAYFGSYNTSSSTAQVAASTNALNDGQWHFLVGYRDNTAASIGLYVDGVLQATTASSAGQSYTGWYRFGDYKLNGWPGVAGDGYFSGGVDEIKVSHFIRSPGWIQTEYTDQASPGTFYSLAAEAANNTNVTTFAQTPIFCSAFVMPSNNLVIITNFITVTNGVMPANPAITALLQYNGTNLITLANPTYSATASNLVWSGMLTTNVTVPAGQNITYVLSNAQAGVTFHVNYDSTNAPSKIILPASTVITLNTLGVYDAPYPGGNLVTAPAAGSTLYVRANVSDPFGSYDVTSLGLAITGPSPGANVSTNLTEANDVQNDGCSKTYEFAWTTGPTTGNYLLAATANEGTEGVSASAGASVSLIFLDLGVPSTTVFTSGTNGPATNSYPANGLACIRVTAPDSITNSAIVQVINATVTSTTGDSELITLTETGTNTGIYTTGLATSSSSGTATNDGTLFAPAGSIITVSYIDPNNSSYSSSATAIITPPPGVAAVVMTKTLVSPAGGQVGVGQLVTYNLQVYNTGSTTLTNVVVTDNFPTNKLAYMTASLAATATNASGILTWTNLGSLLPSQGTNIIVSFITQATGSATNSATANSATATNSSSVALLITRAALNITKTVLSPAVTPVAISSNVVFRITIQNTGNTAVPTLPFEDDFSGAYYQFVSATIPPNGSGAGSLVWTNLAWPTPLATNAIITNDITMKVVGAGSPANNTAVADYAVDSFGNPVPTASYTTGVVTSAASIIGHVYNDINQSGVFTNGDSGLAGVTLQLFTDPNGDGNPADGTLVQIVTTDASGYYELLNLTTGHYVVVEKDLPGYASSAPANGRLALNLTTLTVTNNNNFFQYQPSPASYSTISGTVWNDANGNGTNDPAETGLANVGVDLVQDVNSNGVADAGEPVAAGVLADANGNYVFAGVTAGHYVIRQTLAYGYYSTGDAQGRTDNQISFVSTNGNTVTNASFFDRQLPIAVNDTNAAFYLVPTVIYPLTNDISFNGDTLTIAGASSTNGVVVINPGSTNLSFIPTNSGVATITYTNSDGHGGTATAVITVNVTALADLAIGKTAAATVYAGSNLSYTISVTNFGPSGASGVVVTDALPVGVVFVSATGGGVSNNGVASWNLGALTNGQISAVTLVVTAPVTGPLTNTASVSSPISDPNLPNNVTPPVITAVTPVADVGVSKSGPAGIVFGTNFTYTISVTNFGPSTATALSVTDALPAGLQFVSSLPVTTTNGLSQVIWSAFGDLAAHTGTNLTLTVISTARGTATNIATGGSPVFDPVPTNNVAPPVVTAITNIPPLANPDSYAVAENTTNTFSPLTNDVVRTPGGNLTIIAVNPTNGTATISGTNVIFTPTLNFVGTATVGYTITDNVGGTNSSLITVTVTNLPPTAFGQSASLTENTAKALTLTGNDPTSLPLTFIIVSGPANGVLTAINTNTGAVTYTPNANYIGADAFTFRVNNGYSSSPTVTVNLTVTNLPPAANPDSYAVSENSTNTLSPLVNDVLRTPGGTLTIIGVSPTNGTASISGTNVIFTPTLNFTGLATIGYTITDGIGGTNSSLITVTVTNIPPVANPDSYAIAENTTNHFSPLLNDVVRTPGGSLSLVSVTATNGAATISGTNVVFTPALDFIGVATIGYTITDGIGGTNVSLITVTVTNVPPLANPDSYAVAENTTNTFSPLTNDVVRTPGGVLAIVSVSPTNGTATISGTNVIFTPTPNFVGTATIGYTITDGLGGTNSALVTVNVTNLPPTAFGQSVSLTENTAKALLLTGNDPTSLPLTFVIVSGPANGVLTTVNTNTGAVTYTPNANYIGADAFTFRVNNGYNSSPAATINLTVTNLPPVANPDNYTVKENSTNTFSPLVNDTVSTPGGNLSLVSVSTTNGTATVSGTNVVFTPAINFVGPVTLGYTITDSIGGTNNGVITVTVTGLADIAVSKRGPANVQAGTNFDYVITVTNLGPDSVSSLSVTDNLPVTVGFFSATPGATASGSLVVWTNLGSLVAGAMTNLTVTVTAPADGASLTNLASGGSPTEDPNPTNNLSQPVFTTVTPAADLAIGKSAPAAVFAASNLSYTISVTNFGPSSADNVVVTDALPAGVTFVSATGGGITNAGAVNWNFGTLANGQSSNATLTVTAPASGTLTNVANVNAPTLDPNPTNNVTPPVVTAVTPLADVAVSKTGPAGNLFGANFSYTILVTNLGPSTATALVVTDSLPAGLVFVSSVPVTTTNAGNQIVWSALGDLAAGAGTNLTVTVISTVRGSVTNLASAGSPTLDPVPTNNVAPPVVTAVTNIPPLANPDSYAITENTTNTLSPLVNDVVQTPGGDLSLIGVAATNGTATISGTNIVFVPAANFTGLATIGYTITDNVGGTNSSLVTVLVTNIPPVANPDNYAIAENTTNHLSPLVNDVLRTPGGTLTIIGVSPTNGTASISGTNVIFTPTLNFTGTATIGYTITDGIGGTNSSLITVTVTNLPPVVNPDSYAVSENSTNTLSPLVNDVLRTPGGTLTIIGVSPTNGTASISGTNVIFTPTLNFTGLATIGYTITDGIGGTNSSLITVTVTNIPPVANPDSYAIAENTTNHFSPLLNDVVRTPGGSLSLVSVTATNGAATISGTNVVFTPALDFIGVATIGYTITDGIGGTNVSLITVTVTNVPPLANPDSYAVAENTTNTFSPLTNDVVRTPGGVLAIVSVSPTNGTATISGTNVIFTPTPNFVGTATIGYTITDGLGGTNSALVTVNVTNLPPVANPDSYAMAENTTNTFSPLINDMVLTPGGTLAIIGVSPTNGIAVISGTNLVFTPATNFVGAATIGYTITDGIGGTNSSLITVTVTNVPPVANPDAYGMTENTFRFFSPLLNDLLKTPHGQLRIILASPTNGVVANDGTNLLFTPTSNFVGIATIGYTITDSVGGTNSSLITVTVTNIPPVANPDGYAIAENTTNSFSPLVNDVVSTLGGSLTIIGVSPTNGVANISGTNIIFTPTGNFLGVATIGYTITDGIGGTNSTLVTVTVTNVPPVANPDSYALGENTTNTLSPLVNDVLRTPGGNLTIIGVAPTNGTATISGTNVIFTPSANFVGTATIGYTIVDNVGGTNSSLITVTVTNLPPQANPDLYSVAENSTNSFSPLVNDILRTPGGSLAIIAVNPTNGTATIVGTNVTFVPALNFIGVATIGYAITDNVGGTNRSLITVNVTNLPPTATGQAVSTPENVAKAITLTGSDPANLPLTFIIMTSPANGTLTAINTNTGAVTYTPNVNYTGADTFTFRVNNGYNQSPAATVNIAVTPAADLAVAQSGPASGVAGSNLVFTVTVTNLGPASATNLVVTNQLAVGFTFVSASAGGTNGNNVVIWTLPALAANGVTNLTVTALAAEGGTFTNLASGAAVTPDLNPTNNDGSLANAQTRTVVSALADVQVFKAGGTNVFAGQLVSYVITATNAGPSTATNVVVTDTLPAGAIFQGASGSYATNGGVVTWSAVTLAPRTATTFNVTLLAPASVNSFLNIAAATSPVADPNPTNNNGSLATSRVATKIVPSADLAALLAGPASAILGSNIVYTVTVTNAGPSVASNIVVSDSLPANLLFVSASSGGTSNHLTITWPPIVSLPVGGVTNYTFTVRSLAVGTFPEIASAVAATADPNPTNNTGVLPASQAQTLVALPQLAILVAGTNVLNRQDGLYEQTVVVTNQGTVAVPGVRLYVFGLPAGATPVTLWNASATNSSGVPYVQYNYPVNPAGSVSFALEFYNPYRVAFTNTFTVEWLTVVPPPAVAPTNGFIAGVNIHTDLRKGTRIFLGFPTVIGKNYTVIYANALSASLWQVSVPTFTATANVTQWYDDGPPKTASSPMTATNRFYRVIQN